MLAQALAMPPTAAAAHYRVAAREALRESLPEGHFALSDEVELTALTLFEKSLQTEPALALDRSRSAWGEHAQYMGALAGMLGQPGGALTAGAAAILDSFRCWQHPTGSGRLRTLGGCSEQITASRAGGRQHVECAGFPVEITGNLNSTESSNVEAALQEIVSKTQTKALHLVKGVYVRPFLAEYLSADGQVAGHVDGIASGRRWVGLINASAADSQACRRALFHELGHELDHILSGGEGFFRSSASDNPFGKTRSRADFVSDYAMDSPAEDFAETHAVLIEDWDQIMREGYPPGVIGDKLQWILERGYLLTPQTASGS